MTTKSSDLSRFIRAADAAPKFSERNAAARPAPAGSPGGSEVLGPERTEPYRYVVLLPPDLRYWLDDFAAALSTRARKVPSSVIVRAVLEVARSDEGLRRRLADRVHDQITGELSS